MSHVDANLVSATSFWFDTNQSKPAKALLDFVHGKRFAAGRVVFADRFLFSLVRVSANGFVDQITVAIGRRSDDR